MVIKPKVSGPFQFNPHKRLLDLKHALICVSSIYWNCSLVMTSLNITRQATRLNSFNYTSSTRVSPNWTYRASHSLRVKPRLIHSGSNPSPPPPKKRALVDIALIAAGFFSIGATVLWLQSNRQKKVDDPLFGTVQSREQFEIPIASQ
jgi:hypothetical protein